MERDKFVSIKFRAYMELFYILKRPIEEYTYFPVMLLSVDFDNEVVKVIPFPDSWAEEKSFWTSIEFIELPTKRMRIVNNS